MRSSSQKLILFLQAASCLIAQGSGQGQDSKERWTLPSKEPVPFDKNVWANCSEDFIQFSVARQFLKLTLKEKPVLLDSLHRPIKSCSPTYNATSKRFEFNMDKNNITKCSSSHQITVTTDDYPRYSNCSGVDHRFKDWVLTSNQQISGSHCNINKFVIKPNVNVTITPWSKLDDDQGYVRIIAQSIDIAGRLDASGSGYSGGESPLKPTDPGDLGKSPNATSDSWRFGLFVPGFILQALNAGGPGAGELSDLSHGYSGGGGGYGTQGEDFKQFGGKPYTGSFFGRGGFVYGNEELDILYLGSGGGSGGNDNSLTDNPRGGRGGNGGGAIELHAFNVINITGQVLVQGQPGQGDTDVKRCGDCSKSCGTRECHGNSTTSCYDFSGPGGGGSGGSLHVMSRILEFSGKVSAEGGRGGFGGQGGCGGAGGRGRIAFEYVTKESIGFELLPYYTQHFESTNLTLNKTWRCNGLNHRGKDWILNNSQSVVGVHCNISTFIVPKGSVVSAGSSYFRPRPFIVYAQRVIIHGTLNAVGKGFRGGPSPTRSYQAGNPGTSPQGGGGTGGRGDPGGSHGHPGGGGGYGTRGSSCNIRSAIGSQAAFCGKGGGVYGDPQISTLYLGSGGGSGGNDNYLGDNPTGGRGGNGGGGIFLHANLVKITGQVLVDGEEGHGDSKVTSCEDCPPACTFQLCKGASNTSCWDFSGAGGGGSGGSLHLRAKHVEISGRVSVDGGRGGFGQSSGCGGSGGRGRMKITSNSLTGNYPSFATLRTYAVRDLESRVSFEVAKQNVNGLLTPILGIGCRHNFWSSDYEREFNSAITYKLDLNDTTDTYLSPYQLSVKRFYNNSYETPDYTNVFGPYEKTYIEAKLMPENPKRHPQFKPVLQMLNLYATANSFGNNFAKSCSNDVNVTRNVDGNILRISVKPSQQINTIIKMNIHLAISLNQSTPKELCHPVSDYFQENYHFLAVLGGFTTQPESSTGLPESSTGLPETLLVKTTTETKTLRDCQKLLCSHQCAIAQSGPICICPLNKALANDRTSCLEPTAYDWGAFSLLSVLCALLAISLLYTSCKLYGSKRTCGRKNGFRPHTLINDSTVTEEEEIENSIL